VRGVARAKWYGKPFVDTFSGLRGAIPFVRLPLLAWRIGAVQRHVPCAHTLRDLTPIVRAILSRRSVPGDVVECGCFKGGSTARLSLACAVAGRRLIVYDSFQGLPHPEPDDAEHQMGRRRTFRAGEYAGSLEEVRANVAAHGAINVCEFVPGWFEETMRRVPEQIAIAFVDVDLTESTRTAASALWPRLATGGVLFVHDVTDRKLRNLLESRDLWGDWLPREAAFPTGDLSLARFEK
jgi:O-methyltransferase